MKIVLVRPPTALGELRRTTSLHHPIGLALLAAVLERRGHEAEIVDYEVTPFAAESILRHEPDVVGITAMTATVRSAFDIAAAVKAARPKIKVVLGGVHATVLPARSLEESRGFVDAAVIGEGEERLPRLLDALRGATAFADLDGVAWRENGAIRLNPPRGWIEDLDALPLPNRDKILMELYNHASSPGFSRRFLRITEIFTSRGCVYDCIFCSAPLLSGKRVRLRSLENVVQEMRLCVEKYGIQHFTINDDNFIVSQSRAEEFCDLAAPLGVTWTCETRVNTVTRELLRRMQTAGCRKVSFGLETAAPAAAARVKKSFPAEAIENAFAWAREAGIKRAAFFQVGVHPDETTADIAANERLLRRLDPDYVVVSLATPYPGSELRRIMEERGLIRNDDWSEYRAFTRTPSWRTAKFSPAELVRLQRGLIRRFYFRPRTILRQLRAVRSWREFGYLVAAALALRRLLRGTTPKIRD